MSVKSKRMGQSTGVVCGSRRSATLRCGWMSGVTCTRVATHGIVNADGGTSRSIRQNYTHRGERNMFVCLRHHKSDARLLGSTVNLHEHACDAKWVMCHAAVMVVLDRESAQDGVVALAFTRKELAGNLRAPTRGPSTNNKSHNETVKKHRLPPVTTAVADGGEATVAAQKWWW